MYTSHTKSIFAWDLFSRKTSPAQGYLQKFSHSLAERMFPKPTLLLLFVRSLPVQLCKHGLAVCVAQRAAARVFQHLNLNPFLSDSDRNELYTQMFRSSCTTREDKKRHEKTEWDKMKPIAARQETTTHTLLCNVLPKLRASMSKGSSCCTGAPSTTGMATVVAHVFKMISSPRISCGLGFAF